MSQKDQSTMGRIIKFFAMVAVFCGCQPNVAPPPNTAQLTAMGNQIAKTVRIDPLDNSELDNDAVRRHTAILVAWLANTSEIEVHRMGGAADNEVYLSKDGHDEAVYDTAGKLVTDGVNDGSYNYADPYRDSLGHFTVDVLPWIEMGSSPQDPTTKQMRLEAYLKDLRQGLHRAASGPIPVLGDDFNWHELRRDVPVRLFRMTLSRSGQKLSDVLPADKDDAESLDKWFDDFSDAFSDLIMSRGGSAESEN
jgi:hypothetical protein